MQRAHNGPQQCCVAKWPVRADIGGTVVPNGLRHLLPASTPFQPFPSEIFGVSPNVSNFQGRLPKGTSASFLGAPILRLANNVMRGSVATRWHATRHSNRSRRRARRPFESCLKPGSGRRGKGLAFRKVRLAEGIGIARELQPMVAAPYQRANYTSVDRTMTDASDDDGGLAATPIEVG